MKALINRLKEQAAERQEEAQCRIFLQAIELLRKCPEDSQVREMFIIFASCAAFISEEMALAVLERTAEIMETPDHDIFRVIGKIQLQMN